MLASQKLQKKPVCYNAAGRKPAWLQLSLAEGLGKPRQLNQLKIEESLLRAPLNSKLERETGLEPATACLEGSFPCAASISFEPRASQSCWKDGEFGKAGTLSLGIKASFLNLDHRKISLN